MTGRYVVHVERSIKRTEPVPGGQRTDERVMSNFTLGPFRLKLTARLVAWLESYSSGGWVQRCTIETREEQS